MPCVPRHIRQLRRSLVSIAAILIISFVICTIHMYTYMHRDQMVIHVNSWMKRPFTACNSHFVGFANEFAVLKNARLNTEKKYFSVVCQEVMPAYKFTEDGFINPLNNWTKELTSYPTAALHDSVNVTVANPTFVVMRFEAHNLYHTFCEWYNVFLVSQLLKLDPKQIDILFMDDRPDGLLDSTWRTLFAHIQRFNHYPQSSVFKTLIWSIVGYESPANFHWLNELPYLNEFRKFFLESFGMDSNWNSVNCNNLRVTIIVRHDYNTHPERKGNILHRKFQNEDEILKEIAQLFHGHTIQVVRLEMLTMKEQLEVFTRTDLLFGMHGAGFTHVIFLPKHAAIFEVFPNYWPYQNHFRAFARWRGLKYKSWKNRDPRNEFPNFYTHIPLEVLRSNFNILKKYLLFKCMHVP